MTVAIKEPPPSLTKRYGHTRFWTAADGLLRAFDKSVGVGAAVLDKSAGVQWYLNRRLRELPVAANRIDVRVQDRRMVAEDQNVVQLTLAACDFKPLPRWQPGAHIDVHLPSGRKRQYSLCGRLDTRDHYRIAIRRVPGGGGGSVEAHGLQVGDLIGISKPRNAFYMALPDTALRKRQLRFIAGGIGITPILSMLRQAHQAGLDWSLLYTGRHRQSLPFLDELAEFGTRVTIRTDDVHGVPATVDLVQGIDDDTAIYACGPPDMITAIRAGIDAQSKAELHFERFSPPVVVAGEPFDIELVRSGRVIRVGGEESALAALLRHRPDLAYSCQQGFCGTCVQAVVAGEVDHRERLLTETQRAQGQMLVCVSRAQGGRITLDL
ncbi:PDR/VanB family oxidoreductase [Mycobacteroides abscessus]|uniref:PDR/VanB family oxidoreductase n=1 Tax=Mycobacteroides abscessus TaxID=36809 RepID=UPI000D8F1EA9|nr:PDR/VanB family oxidoreductase [Mycobacteroides abscessus]SPX88011.1 ferredoxin [Mycobacteroides abscessus]